MHALISEVTLTQLKVDELFTFFSIEYLVKLLIWSI